MCKLTSGFGTVEHYRNPNGYTAPVYLDSNRAVGFSNINVSYTNGVLTCSFRRMKAMTNVPNYLEISGSKTYYGLFAVGSFTGGKNNFEKFYIRCFTAVFFILYLSYS